jgi:hypothetical protein
MRRTIAITFAVALLTIVSMNVRGQAPGAHGCLSVLKPGQMVALKSAGERYDITTFQNGPGIMSFKVTEVGPDYVVGDDTFGISNLRIPIYAIRSIVSMRGAPAN